MNYRRLLIIAIACGTVNAFVVGAQLSEISRLHAENNEAWQVVAKWEDTAKDALAVEKRWEALANKWEKEAFEAKNVADRCEGASHL